MRRQYNTCRLCGCSLDPGEGMICEDCRGESRQGQILRWPVAEAEPGERKKAGQARRA